MSEVPIVVVTGGSGMLGSRLIDRLISDYQVISLDLEGDPTTPAPVEFICVDLTSDESADRAVDRIQSIYGPTIASIVHLAAYYDFAGRPSPLYDKVTVEGTRRLVDSFTRLDVEQIVFSSTMLVHEPGEPGERLDEEDPIEATWPYPQSKVETEQVLEEEVVEEHRGDPAVVVLRIAGVYDEDGHSPPIANQVKRIHGRALTSHFYPGDLRRGQAFVHLDDVVDAVVRAIDRRGELGAKVELLIGESDTVGYGDLQDRIATELHGKPWSTYRIPKPVAQVGAWLMEKNPFGEEPFIRSWMVERADDHYALDVELARERLGWTPRHSLEDVLPEMVRRLKQDPERWYRENSLTPPRRAAA